MKDDDNKKQKTLAQLHVPTITVLRNLQLNAGLYFSYFNFVKYFLVNLYLSLCYNGPRIN